jgi:hypothetical protein
MAENINKKLKKIPKGSVKGILFRMSGGADFNMVVSREFMKDERKSVTHLYSQGVKNNNLNLKYRS